MVEQSKIQGMSMKMMVVALGFAHTSHHDDNYRHHHYHRAGLVFVSDVAAGEDDDGCSHNHDEYEHIPIHIPDRPPFIKKKPSSGTLGMSQSSNALVLKQSKQNLID
jgi:hypothetical protein